MHHFCASLDARLAVCQDRRVKVVALKRSYATELRAPSQAKLGGAGAVAAAVSSRSPHHRRSGCWGTLNARGGRIGKSCRSRA